MSIQTPSSTKSTGSRSDRDIALGFGIGLIGVLIFSGTLPATRYAVALFDPGFLTFGRAGVAGIVAAIILVFLRKSFPKNHWLMLFLAGIALVFGFPGFMALAMQTVPSAHGGVILGILPLATAAFATLIAGERPSPMFWFWSAIGAILITVFTLRDGEFGFEIGDLWLFIAGLTASWGYVVSGKLTREIPGWEVICWALVLCLPLSLGGTYWFWQDTYINAPTPQLWAFAYVSFGSMLLGFFAWNTGLNLGGIARVGQLQLLQTFFTLAIAALLFGEIISWETIGFAAAVMVTIIAGKKAQIA